MAGRQILIDGYNVIRGDPNLSGLENRSLEEARDALVRMVAASPRFIGDAITVVFDGARAGQNMAVRRGHVTVVYSSPGTSADDVIKARASSAVDPRSIVVVTNDLDIKRFCEGLGCTVTGSQNLVEQIAAPRRLKVARETAEPNDRVGERDGTGKKGNPKRLPKRLRNKREYRF